MFFAASPSTRARPAAVPLRLTTLACLCLLAAAPAAHAARHYPKVIKDAMGNGVQVVRTFPAASGLTGWVLSQNGTYSVAYTTADKKTIIVGNLINEKGENLTDHYAEKYFPKPDRAALFNQLEQSAWVAEGTLQNPKSVLYVFADTDNPLCRYLWKALQPYQRAGLQVRWVLVATPNSMSKASEALEAADPAAVFRKPGEEVNKFRALLQGLAETANPEAKQKIKKNNALMEQLDVTGTPGLVWKDRAGKMQVKSGMPRLSEIPAITGLPRQEIDDPDLVKFK